MIVKDRLKVKKFARMIFMTVENSEKAEKTIQRLCKGQIKMEKTNHLLLLTFVEYLLEQILVEKFKMHYVLTGHINFGLFNKGSIRFH